MLIQTNQRELSAADVVRLVQRHKLDCAHKRRLKRYYLGKHDILSKVGRTNTDVNNKLVANYPAYITNMCTGFFIGQPVTYRTTTEHEAELETLLEVFRYNDEAAHNVELAEEASITGEAFEFLYLDGDAQIRLATVPSEEVIIVTDATLEQNILAAIRHFSIKNLDGTTYDEFVDVYDAREVRHYKYDGGLKLLASEPHYFDDVPVVAFNNNRQRRGDFEDVLTLVDAYNMAQSLTLDDLQNFTDAFLVLVGMGGTDDEDATDGTPRRPHRPVKESRFENTGVYQHALIGGVMKLKNLPTIDFRDVDVQFTANIYVRRRFLDNCRILGGVGRINQLLHFERSFIRRNGVVTHERNNFDASRRKDFGRRACRIYQAGGDPASFKARGARQQFPKNIF